MEKIALELSRHFIEPEIQKIERSEWAASYLRKEFKINRKIASIHAYATACGMYQLYINGKNVTEELFKPGFTNYYHRLQYQKYDITPLVMEGDNTIGVLLGNGWYRGWSGCTGGMGEKFPVFGDKVKFAEILCLTYEDGEEEIICTNTDFKATQEGPLRYNDMRGGVVYDCRKEMVQWNENGFDDSKWHAVIESSYKGKLIPVEGLPVVRHEVIKGRLFTAPNGDKVIDFGQNLAGYTRFQMKGEEGRTVSIVHGETLDEHGNFTQKNLQLENAVKPFGQVITYTMKNGSQIYEPTFTYMGFRYGKLINFPESIKAEDFEAVAVYTDIKMNGDFECSDEDINQFIRSTRWSLKSNFVDIPTDCPTREHSGWTGDAMVFCEAANWLADCEVFWKKWLRDVAIQQTDKGVISCIVPDANPKFGKYIDGSAGWGDAIEVIPYKAYEFYHNIEMIEEFYPNVCRWVEMNRKRASKKNIRNLIKQGKHRKYILDTGYHWGEWSEPDMVLKNAVVNNMFFPDAEAATAYFAYSAKMASKMADLLGKKEDEKKYKELYERAAEAYRKEFLPNGLPLETKRQCRYVRPIALDLVSEEEKFILAEKLSEIVAENDYKIGTGFLTTGYILSALSDYGQLETAYKLLENRKTPGWLYEMRKGATTIWEHWDGIDENNVPSNSLNHYSKGSMISWLFKEMCGIHFNGGKSFIIAPKVGGSCTYAKAKYTTSFGDVVSAWEITESGTKYTIIIPSGTTAHISLPGAEKDVEAGTYEYWFK